MSSGLGVFKGKWVQDGENIGQIVGEAVVDDTDYLVVDWTDNTMTLLSDVVGTIYYPTELDAAKALPQD